MSTWFRVCGLRVWHTSAVSSADFSAETAYLSQTSIACFLPDVYFVHCCLCLRCYGLCVSTSCTVLNVCVWNEVKTTWYVHESQSLTCMKFWRWVTVFLLCMCKYREISSTRSHRESLVSNIFVRSYISTLTLYYIDQNSSQFLLLCRKWLSAYAGIRFFD